MALAGKLILYFVPELRASCSGVLHSQVFSQAIFLKKNGAFPFFVGTERKGDVEKGKGVLESYGLDGKVFATYPVRTNALTLLIWALLTAIIFVIKNKKSRFDYVYIRSVSALFPGLFLKFAYRSQLVFDFRALISAEVSLRNRGILARKILQLLERSAIRRSDKLCAVTNALKEKIGIVNRRKDVKVIPSCADLQNFCFSETSRNTIRANIGIEKNDIVIAYCGSASAWQKFDETLVLLVNLVRCRKEIYGLILSQNAVYAAHKLEKYPDIQNKIFVFSVTRAEVCNYLSAGDIGLLLRDNIPVNHVASPIKAAEYLACGLAIGISKNIGDVTNKIIERNAGIVLEGNIDEMTSSIVKLIDSVPFKEGSVKENALKLAQEYFCWSAHINKYISLYK